MESLAPTIDAPTDELPCAEIRLEERFARWGDLELLLMIPATAQVRDVGTRIYDLSRAPVEGVRTASARPGTAP